MTSNPIGVIIGILLLMVTGNALATEIDCVPLDPREQVSKETENDIRGAVETLFKIGKIEGKHARRVKEEATLIYKDHPNYDQLVLNSKLIFLFCETLKKGGFSGDEQQKRLLDFIKAISFVPVPGLPSEQHSKSTPRGKWILAGEDTFTVTRSKWPTFSFTSKGGFKRLDAKIIGGKYRFDFETNRKAIRIFDSPYGAAVDYRWGVSIRMVSFNSNHIMAGLLFGQRAGIGYQFSFLSTGSWAIHKTGRGTGTSSSIIEWTYAEIDPKKWNRLEVEVAGELVRVRINSQVVGTYKERNLAGGTVGIYVASGQENGMAVIDFDDFEYYRKENY